MQLKLIDPTVNFNPNKIVTNSIAIKNGKFLEDGIFSPTIFGKLEDTGENYSCICEENPIIGRFHSGEICPICNEEVKARSSNLSKKGWIDFEEYWIINPFFYKQLDKVFGKNLEKIIIFEPKVNSNGIILKDNNSKIKYQNLGLVKFKKNFIDILNYYYKLNKDKIGVSEAYEFIIKNLDLIFINKFLVYSVLLRPATKINDSFTFAEENVDYNLILSNLNALKNKKKLERSKLNELNLLYSIQMSVNKIFDKIISILIGKTGFLRNSLLGSRVNFSVRTVIGPLASDSGFEIDEVKFPYLAAVELFKFEIINILAGNTSGYLEAHKIWFESTLEYSNRVWNILNELVERTEGGLTVLVNRNPTIQLGSILYCRIKEIKKKYDDLTLNIHNNILSLLAADYDGDVITTISVKDLTYKKLFEKFNPKNMLISNDNGKFNSFLELPKIYQLGLTTFLD